MCGNICMYTHVYVCMCSLVALVQDQHDYYEVFSVVLFLLLLLSFFCFSWFFSSLPLTPLSLSRSSLFLSRVPLSGEFWFLFLVLFYLWVFIDARASHLKQLKWRPQAAVCRLRFDDIEIHVHIYIGCIESEVWKTFRNCSESVPMWISPRKRHMQNMMENRVCSPISLGAIYAG